MCVVPWGKVLAFTLAIGQHNHFYWLYMIKVHSLIVPSKSLLFKKTNIYSTHIFTQQLFCYNPMDLGLSILSYTWRRLNVAMGSMLYCTEVFRYGHCEFMFQAWPWNLLIFSPHMNQTTVIFRNNNDHVYMHRILRILIHILIKAIF